MVLHNTHWSLPIDTGYIDNAAFGLDQVRHTELSQMVNRSGTGNKTQRRHSHWNHWEYAASLETVRDNCILRSVMRLCECESSNITPPPTYWYCYMWIVSWLLNGVTGLMFLRISDSWGSLWVCSTSFLPRHWNLLRIFCFVYNTNECNAAINAIISTTIIHFGS